MPMAAGDHPELDQSELLDENMHRKYQMLIRMIIWIVTIGRLDIAFSMSFLERVLACHRQAHLDRVFHVFSYLKYRPNRRIMIDSNDIHFLNEEEDLEKDLTKDLADEYPDVVEDVDVNLPEPLVSEIRIMTFIDSDHAHDHVKRRSISEILILVGKTPVYYRRKRQGEIETSTCGAEFSAMRSAFEETLVVRYIMRYLRVKVEYATPVCGDNKGVIMNALISDSLLKKKHVAIYYQKTRESAEAGIIQPVKIDGKYNYADIFPKSQVKDTFMRLIGELLYYHCNGAKNG